MKALPAFLLAASLLLAADRTPGTWTGYITDTMCGKDHARMGVTPDPKCVEMCTQGHGSHLALLAGDKVYKLHDQRTPAKFAGRKVKVRGTLYEKTQILKFDSIEPAR